MLTSYLVITLRFAALKNDGSVVTWGNSSRGGNSSSVASSLTNVKQIFSNVQAFAALKRMVLLLHGEPLLMAALVALFKVI